MDMLKIISSNLDEVGYDQEKSQLVVKFKGGSTYAYDEAPPEIYEKLIEASSPGSFFHHNIKNKFPTTKIS